MRAISIPFRFTTSGNVNFVTNAEKQVQQRIIDVLMTVAGERIARPSYGGGIKEFLFELNDPLVFADYRLDAVAALNENVSGVQIVDIKATTGDLYGFGTPDESTITIRVQYRLPPFGLSTMSLTLDNSSLYTQESIL